MYIKFNNCLAEGDYRTGEDLFEIYKRVKNMDGRLLLNLGLKEDGSFDNNEIKSLNNFIDLF